MAFPAKKKSFSDDVQDEMGKGPDDDYAVSMDDAESGDDDAAQGDRVMAVKQLGKALGVTVADPEAAAEALRTFIDNC